MLKNWLYKQIKTILVVLLHRRSRHSLYVTIEPGIPVYQM